MSKDKVINLINQIYDEDDLWEIYTAIDKRLNKVQEYQQKIRDVSSIIKSVKEEGFICLTKRIEIKDPDVLSMDLYANIYVYTYGGVNKKDLVVDHLVADSDTWISELEFDCLCEYDQLILPDSQGWDYGDHGDPYNAIAKFKVQILYLQKDFPGKDFRYIDSDGLVKIMTVKGDKLYTDDKYFGDVDKWDTYKLLIV